MSHARGRRDSCWLQTLSPQFHSIRLSIARGMTDVGVGSGALLGWLAFPDGIMTNSDVQPPDAASNTLHPTRGPKALAGLACLPPAHGQNTWNHPSPLSFLLSY